MDNVVVTPHSANYSDAAVLFAGRSPANIMLAMAKQDAELKQNFFNSRCNDPCP